MFAPTLSTIGFLMVVFCRFSIVFAIFVAWGHCSSPQAFNSNNMADQDFDNLREKLNTLHTWPSVYLFKFIVKSEEQKTKVLELFNVSADQVQIKASSKGTYQSISIYKDASDAEEIIDLYRSASEIDGLISL